MRGDGRTGRLESTTLSETRNFCMYPELAPYLQIDWLQAYTKLF